MTKVLPGQLSLPLFELDPDTRKKQHTPPDATLARPRVASSRSETQPVRVAAKAETASAAAPLLTTSETAALLHVHPRTVQRLVERGELAAIHLGSAVRFDSLDLAGLTSRLKLRRDRAANPLVDTLLARPGSAVCFADRLRSHQHEHRAAEA